MNHFKISVSREYKSEFFFKSATEYLTNNTSNQNRIVIIDSEVYSGSKPLQAALANLPVFKINNPEISLKSLDGFEKLITEISESKTVVDRNFKVIAIGGGALLDGASFLSSVFKRGLSLTLIPTTLLAMVDSCAGGKTAINLKGLKNIIGTIYPAEEIIIDIGFLKTLPKPEITNGVIEAIKNLSLLNHSYLHLIDPTQGIDFENLISASLQTKLEVIKTDPWDNDQRKILNYGHTLAHALEGAFKNRIKHGIAVGIGICVSLKYFSEEFPQKDKLFQLFFELIRAHLPSKIDAKVLLPFILEDKKMKDGFLDEVVLKDIGHPELVKVKPKELIDAFSEFQEFYYA